MHDFLFIFSRKAPKYGLVYALEDSLKRFTDGKLEVTA